MITEKPADGKRDIVIAIDPGHGGEDPGSIGYSGTYEKTVTLKMSCVPADIINKEPDDSQVNRRLLCAIERGQLEPPNIKLTC